MAVIAIQRHLREKLGDEATEELVDVLTRVESEAQRNVATKEDIANLELRLIKWVIGTGIGVVTSIFALLKLMK
ncbi:MAG: hypothetical protein HZA20_00265 [Nitrospirae bacterium]|nr:hypothetical protein [Nitrospirota bacterium]